MVSLSIGVLINKTLEEGKNYNFDVKKQRILPALKGQLKKAKEEMEIELKSIDNNKVTANPYKLISLSYLNIN